MRLDGLLTCAVYTVTGTSDMSHVACSPPLPTTRVAVYHYVSKSLEDFETKVLRGGGAGITRDREYFDQV